ncbi:MAG: mechanosensitive ion channel [Planctomycetota bacterium]|nr:mechanosensitive ion channel [Planctomycetota bacterium]MDP6763278.1 mechanosensitive ion channel [Planctomycetota bacterium]MDP6988040.1 mechanosensitive ion channel [Planctomycetota bacterium]
MDKASHLSEDWLRMAGTYTLEYGPRVLQAIAILVVGWFAANFARGLVRRVLVRADTAPVLVGFLSSLSQFALKAFVVIAAISKLGVETASFVAVLGAGAFAVGLALQGSLSNFAAGVMLMIFRPFKVGDYVEAGGTAGTVEEVGVFAATLRTGDNKRIIVANASITGGNITNYSANSTRRVDMVFGIGYDDDIAEARRVIAAILEADERVMSDPEPLIAVGALGESSVELQVRPWVATGDYWGVFRDTQEAVKLAFDGAGISLPYPHREVRVHQMS